MSTYGADVIRQRAMRARRRAAGLCIMCGRRPQGRFATCRRCRQRDQARRARGEDIDPARIVVVARCRCGLSLPCFGIHAAAELAESRPGAES